MDPNAPQPLQPPVSQPVTADQLPTGSPRKKILKIAILLFVLILISIGAFMAYKIAGSGKAPTTPLPDTPVPTVALKPTLPPFPDESVSQNSLIIRFKNGSSPDDLAGTQRLKDLDSIFTNLGVIKREKIDDYAPELPDLSYKLTFKEGVDVEKAANEIYKLTEIDHAEPDIYYDINN